MSKDPELTPAAAYCRKSTREDDRQVASISDQEREIRAWAADHDHEVVRVYTDQQSGGDEDRPGFQQMIADAENGAGFEAVIVWDLSRFGRFGTTTHGFYEKRLNDAGVVVNSLDIPAEGPTAELLKGNMSWIAQQKARQIGRDSLRGRITRAKQGARPAGVPPFGYDLADIDDQGVERQRLFYVPRTKTNRAGRADRRMRPERPYSKNPSWTRTLVASKDAARVAAVRRAFDLAAHGRGCYAIARILGEEGHPSPTGAGWNISSVYALLTNPVYKGQLAYGRSAQGRYYTIQKREQVERKVGRRGRRPRAEGAQHAIVRDDAHEALVESETWEAAQKQREFNRSRQQRGQRSKTVYLLSGLAKCSACGSSLIGHTHRTPKRRWVGHYYVCSGYRHRGKAYCDRSTAKQASLEPAVVGAVAEALEKQLGDLSHDVGAARELERQLSRRRPASKPRRGRNYEAEIAALLEQIRFDADNRVEHLACLDRLQAEQREAAESSEEHGLSGSDLNRWREQARHLLGDIREMLLQGDPQTVKALLRHLVVDVSVDNNEGRFRLRLPRLSEPGGAAGTAGGSEGSRGPSDASGGRRGARTAPGGRGATGGRRSPATSRTGTQGATDRLALLLASTCRSRGQARTIVVSGTFERVKRRRSTG